MSRRRLPRSPRRAQPLAKPVEPVWRWNTSGCYWALPAVTDLDVEIRLEHEAEAWAVVLVDSGGCELQRIALALGDFAAHKALGRMLWRRLQRVPIEFVGLLQ